MNLEDLLDSLILEEAERRYVNGLPALTSEEIQKFVHDYLAAICAGARAELEKRKSGAAK